MTSKKQSKQTVRLDVVARIREGVKAVLGGHPLGGADRAPRGWLPGASPHQAWRAQSGSYTCNLVTPTGNIERLEVRLDRECEFVTELSGRYKRVTGDFEEDCPFTLGEDRAHQEHADMPPDSFGKSGANGAKTRIISVDMVRTRQHFLADCGAERTLPLSSVNG